MQQYAAGTRTEHVTALDGTRPGVHFQGDSGDWGCLVPDRRPHLVSGAYRTDEPVRARARGECVPALSLDCAEEERERERERERVRETRARP